MDALSPLPIVLSIPHAGLATPDPVAPLLALGERDLYNECDLWADRLYDITPGVLSSVRAEIARAIVDVNRPPDDLDDRDGPIKAQSSYGVQAYAQPLTRAQKIDLRDTYWAAYHYVLDTTLKLVAPQVRLLLDCHNMAQRGPATYAHPGAARPFVCLANLGDRNGEPKAGGAVTCPPDLLRYAGTVAEELFSDMTLLEPDGDAPPVVALNYPFAGGYIIKRYTQGVNLEAERLGHGLAPMSIMVEINRGLFVGNQNATTPVTPANDERIEAIRSRISQWAAAVCAEIEQRFS